MRKNVMSTLAAALAFGAAGAVFADDQKTFESLDGNGDGFITRDEVPADSKLANDFATWDTDRDGRLSRAEFDAKKSAKDQRSDGY